MSGAIIRRACTGDAAELARLSGELGYPATVDEIASLLVRSNTARTESHPFYERLGYTRSKTQHVYTKAVTGQAAAMRTPQTLDAEA